MPSVKTVSILFTVLVLTLLTSGCIDNKQILDAVSPLVVLKGSDQYCIQLPEECNASVSNSSVNASVNMTPVSYVVVETPPPTPTPIPTVTVEPTSTYRYFDPFAPGQRYEGQWFKWHWDNASGLQDANRGIVVYGHSYHDSFTQWNDAWGNYQTINPNQSGYRFLAVYVHMEDFGPDDNGLWGYDDNYFNLQYHQQLHKPYNGYDRVFRIFELESKSNYYSIEYLKPYGAQRVYGGMTDVETGGYHIEDYWSLRSGRGNAWDGYIIYLVPVSITDRDILIVGNFAGRAVNWRFDGEQKFYPTVENPEDVNLLVKPEPQKERV